MRPSELLRRHYRDREANREGGCIFMHFVGTEEVCMAGVTRVMNRYASEIVKESANTIIAKACYAERLASTRDRDEYRRYPLYKGNVMTYIPHECVPIEWCIKGGV